ncbi:glucokinase-like ROK family protein [Planifilum fimeticola]|uniref:Glucokinase-like ROK family protein n=1 Tax=Planifilum fimeticola TaxID=201975 RepID=A0A2T0LFM2_9BACL|nr:ROK family transcriptional regulator [Planifilum fimeticola]PRX41025.1 glucokinase-like ROK family protein [Planifilum fimeticola]
MRHRNAKTSPHQPQVLKQLNKRLILQTIRRRQPVSRAEIAEETTISRTTVSQLTDELLREGWIREVGQGVSGAKGGRKPITLSINDDAAWVVGVDIGGCGTTIALCNLAGQIKQKRTFPSPRTSMLDTLSEQLQRFLSQVDPEIRIIGLGIGAPGITRSSDGVVLSAPALGWTDVPLKRLLEERLGLPVYVDNDVNVAALGECWKGAGKDKQNVIMITVGTGIGCGLVLDGALYRGSGWAAGEIGSMVTDADAVDQWTDPVFAGFGFLESKAGGPGIVRQILGRMEKTDSSSPLRRDADRLTAKEVFDAARKGEPLAKSVVSQSIRHLAAGIINAVVLFDPEVVILGGGLMGSADLMLPKIREAVKRLSPTQPEIRKAQLGSDAGVIGGAALVLKECSEPIGGVL